MVAGGRAGRGTELLRDHEIKLTLLEAVPEAAVHVLKMLHAAGPGGLPADGLHTPVVCMPKKQREMGEKAGSIATRDAEHRHCPGPGINKRAQLGRGGPGPAR